MLLYCDGTCQGKVTQIRSFCIIIVFVLILNQEIKKTVEKLQGSSEHHVSESEWRNFIYRKYRNQFKRKNPCPCRHLLFFFGIN